MATTPRFPAIAISLGDSFNVAESMLDEASPRALKNGYFERLYFFDSNGELWRVVQVEKTSAPSKGPLGKRVGVRLSLSTPERPHISEVAEDLCRLVDEDPDDLYDQCMTHEELKELFRSAGTATELIAAAGSLGCDDDELDEEADVVVIRRETFAERLARRSPRMHGLVTAGFGLAGVALNLVTLALFDRYYPFVTAGASAMLAIGLWSIVTNHSFLEGDSKLPGWWKAGALVAACIGVVGGFLVTH
jgi:hypothetical protein